MAINFVATANSRIAECLSRCRLAPWRTSTQSVKTRCWPLVLQKKKCEELKRIVDEVTALDARLALVEPFARAWSAPSTSGRCEI